MTTKWILTMVHNEDLDKGFVHLPIAVFDDLESGKANAVELTNYGRIQAEGQWQELNRGDLWRKSLVIGIGTATFPETTKVTLQIMPIRYFEVK